MCRNREMLAHRLVFERARDELNKHMREHSASRLDCWKGLEKKSKEAALGGAASSVLRVVRSARWQT